MSENELAILNLVLALQVVVNDIKLEYVGWKDESRLKVLNRAGNCS
jgi:hypothetical protein